LTHDVKSPPVYVEVDIRAPLETVWERTHQPDSHARWDLRFSRLEYLPPAGGRDLQRLLYTTRIGFGLKIRGEGAFVGSKDAVDGSRTTGLRFWCSDRRSLIRSGSGYWRYIPNEGGTTFLTRFDYETRFGRGGALFDRLLVRPLLRWATAWSFDRLRLWLEQGIQPEVARRHLLPRARRCRRTHRLGRL
jgi:polyketide cyclase/dehydrase/lipid transport protein